MPDTVQIGVYNGQYDISSADTTYQLAYGHYILQTKDGGLAGIREINGSQNNTIRVDGAVASSGLGGYGLEIDGLNTTVHVGTSGSINAKSAIVTYGDNAHIINEGKIEGDVYLVGSPKSSFSNMGSLIGAIRVSSSDKCDVEIGGNGILTAAEGITVTNASGVTSHTTNYGQITGSTYAFSGGYGEETLVNRGTLKGAVILYAGDDLFDNRLGSVDDVVKGGEGDDIFVIDKKIAISELSGEGTDTIRSTISMSLSTGVLAGQSLENLRLIGTGDANGTGNSLANTIVGNGYANILSGRGGADVLSGGKGNDVLDGGAGNDRLTGGIGADTFIFKSGHGHDKITDFGNGADHIDLQAWKAIADFKDLLAHHLSVSGDSLVIHAGSDELVLQHTTKAGLHAGDFVF